jgi:hypothetical protein
MAFIIPDTNFSDEPFFVSTKANRFLLLFAGVFVALTCHAQPRFPRAAQKASAGGNTNAYKISQIGPHSCVWQNSAGQSVTSIATGMNYSPDGEHWLPSDNSFAISQDGMAFVAEKIQHQTRIAANINTSAAVTVTTPNGVTLRSTPIAIGLFDPVSGKSVVVAEITNSSGVLVDAQHLVFSHAFVGGGFDASVVYSLPDVGSFHQDVIFTGFDRNFDPTAWGFAAASAKQLQIQIFTEFYDVPQPQFVERPLYVEQNPTVRAGMAAPDFIDYTLNWGDYVMIPGRAYTTTTNASAGAGVTVAKDFVTSNGRTFLVETVPYQAIANELGSLPAPAVKTSSIKHFPSAMRTKVAAASIPSLKDAKRGFIDRIVSGKAIASASEKPSGLAVDYIATISGTGPTLFSSDTTYFVTGNVYLTGPTTMEDAVFKFPTSAGSIEVESTLTLTTTNYKSATFTAADDDSVGCSLFGVWSGWTGNPVGQHYGNVALWLMGTGNISLNNLRFRYLTYAIEVNAHSSGQILNLSNSQMVNCAIGVYVNGGNGSGFGGSGSGSLTLNANNCLVENMGTALQVYTIILKGNAYNWTLDNCTNLFSVSTAMGNYSFTNSIFSTLHTKGTLGSVTLAAGNNGFYGSTAFGSSTATATSTPFQTSSTGNYYLNSNSTGGILFQGVGTSTGISAFLSTLKTKTTRPPIALPLNTTISGALALFPQVPRYASGNPDLGYYYDVLDYTVAYANIVGGAVTVEPGTAIATRNDYWDDGEHDPSWTVVGFDLGEGSSIISHGTPTSPITFTAASSVQEQPQLSVAQYQIYMYASTGSQPPNTISFIASYDPDTALNQPAPSLDFRFSNFNLSDVDYHFGSGFDEWDGLYYQFSYDSSMYLSLRDCNIHSGRFNLGKPGFNTYDYTQVFAAGAISLSNNLFDRVDINLDPTLFEWGYGINCDMQVQAYNNLFRGGHWFHLEPFPASAGHWVFKNNLFDSVNLLQDVNSYALGAATPQPLDYDYNAYWPLTAAQLAADLPFDEWSVNFGLQNNAELIPTSGGVDGTAGNHEVILTAAPSYQVGPLGNYYMPTTSPLHSAGSQSAASAGLSQYTTAVNQTKELGKTQVDIGLHYVATASSTSTQPNDYDSDGIPDYVEDAVGNGATGAAAVALGETDWMNPKTDGVNNDPVNAAYLNTDLAGWGMVGNVTTNLGISPLSSYSPLTLSQVVTGDEPDIITFKVPVNYSLLTSIGTMKLWVDGTAPVIQDAVVAPDGNTYLRLNTDYAGWILLNPAHGFPNSPLAAHSVQACINLKNVTGQATLPNPTISTAFGPPSLVLTTNVAQFTAVDADFDSTGATLSASLAEANANYTITLTDGNTGASLSSVTGSTVNGQIAETWNLTKSDGTTWTGTDLYAQYNITLTDSGTTKTQSKHMTKDNPNITDGDVTVAYAWPIDSEATRGNSMWDCMQWGAVDVLMDVPLYGSSPGTGAYTSHFDISDGNGSPYPGYLHTPADVPYLLTNLALPTTENFIFNGHGSPNSIGNRKKESDPELINIGPADIQNALTNNVNTKYGPERQHPYRFVFLDACQTADDLFWANAFGILGPMTSLDVERNPYRVQAFVGFKGHSQAQGSDSDWWDYEATYLTFFNAWMNGLTLEACLKTASSSDPIPPNNITLGFPLGKKFGLPYSLVPGINDFRLVVYGYPWITRSGYFPGYQKGPYDPQ